MNNIPTQELQKLKEISFPHKKMELWKHTDLSKLGDLQLNFIDKNISQTVPTKIVQLINQYKKFSAIEKCHYLVIVNGQYIADLSSHDRDISVEYNHGHKDSKLPHSYTENDDYEQDDTFFNKLSKNIKENQLPYLSIRINERVKLQNLLHIISFSYEKKLEEKNSHGLIHFPLFFLSLGKMSEMTLIESHLNEDGELALNNARSEIDIEEGAILHHGKLSYLGENSHFIQNQNFKIERNGQLSTFHMNLSGPLARYQSKISLKGEGARSFIGGVCFLDKEDQCNNYLTVEHQVPHTESRQYFKGILNDKSHNVFRGKVVVKKMAKPIIANQLSRNLLMSDKARVDMQPQLEIYADDVKCQHGASIGQISDEELFYLESRGISKEKSKKLLSKAFVMDALFKIENNHLKDFFISLLNQKIEKRTLW